MAQLVAAGARPHAGERIQPRDQARGRGRRHGHRGDRRGTFAAGSSRADNGLADQLKMVARLIRGRSSAGRQAPGVLRLDGRLRPARQPDRQPARADEAAERRAWPPSTAQTVELGIADKVTTFTASDFGRTLASNGDGSDHGWGSHHFMVGGAVKGKEIYGTRAGGQHQQRPQLAGYDGHVGQGRLIPDHLGRPVRRHARQVVRRAATRNLPEHPAEPQELRRQLSDGIDYPKNVGFMT